jgi:hypothetical protein
MSRVPVAIVAAYCGLMVSLSTAWPQECPDGQFTATGTVGDIKRAMDMNDGNLPYVPVASSEPCSLGSINLSLPIPSSCVTGAKFVATGTAATSEMMEQADDLDALSIQCR